MLPLRVEQCNIKRHQIRPPNLSKYNVHYLIMSPVKCCIYYAHDWSQEDKRDWT